MKIERASIEIVESGQRLNKVDVTPCSDCRDRSSGRLFTGEGV